MALTVPSTDTQHYNLQQRITQIGTQITNVGTSNGALVSKLQRDQIQAQHDLVLSLLGSGHLSAASVLSSGTYITLPAIS